MFDDDRFGGLLRAATYVSVYAAGWIVANTVVPEWAFEVVAFVLVAAPVAGGFAVARAAGFELSPGQCRAETNSGDRCSRRRPPNRDLCWQHQRLHDVTMHPEGIAEKRAEKPLPTTTFRD